MPKDRRNWRGIAVGVTAALALFALLIQLQQEAESDVKITFLGFTNQIRHASADLIVPSPRLVFSVSNASRHPVSLAGISRLYTAPIAQGRLHSYLIPSTPILKPGEFVIERYFMPADPPPWRFDLAYNNESFKDRVIQHLGGRGTFLGRSIAETMDFFSPTQKFRWAYSESIGGTNTLEAQETALFPTRRYHINAPPPAFKFEQPTNHAQ